MHDVAKSDKNKHVANFLKLWNKNNLIGGGQIVFFAKILRLVGKAKIRP